MAAANCATHDLMFTDPHGVGVNFTHDFAYTDGSPGIPAYQRRKPRIIEPIGGNRPFEHGHTIQRSTDHPGCTGKRRRRRNRHRQTTGGTP